MSMLLRKILSWWRISNLVLMGYAPMPHARPASTPPLPDPLLRVVDVSESRVKIEYPTILHTYYRPVLLTRSQADELLRAEADRACALYGRIASQEISRECTTAQLYATMSVGELRDTFTDWKR